MFDGLLPEPHNTGIARLLFTCAHFHGLAKLRLHTEETLAVFDEVTVQLGVEFRKFQSKTCSAFNTRELQREKDARSRRQKKKEKPPPQTSPISHAQSTEVNLSTQHSSRLNGSASDTGVDNPDNLTSGDPSPANKTSHKDERRSKKFSLTSYKYHSLGDYPATIRHYGTLDSFSTEPVSCNCYCMYSFSFPLITYICYRASWSIGYQKHDTKGRTGKPLSNNLLKLSAAKLAFDA